MRFLFAVLLAATVNAQVLNSDGGVSSVGVTPVANETSSSGGPITTSGAITVGLASAINLGSKTSTAVFKSGTTPPVTCSVGQQFFDTDATAGSNFLGCTATNTWTVQGGGGVAAGVNQIAVGPTGAGNTQFTWDATNRLTNGVRTGYAMGGNAEFYGLDSFSISGLLNPTPSAQMIIDSEFMANVFLLEDNSNLRQTSVLFSNSSSGSGGKFGVESYVVSLGSGAAQAVYANAYGGAGGSGREIVAINATCGSEVASDKCWGMFIGQNTSAIDENYGLEIGSIQGAVENIAIETHLGLVIFGDTTQAPRYATTTNCADPAGAAACGSAAAGAFVVDAAGTSVVVSTTAVTANSRIKVTFDASVAAELGITCNATIPALYGITARTPGVSFTLTSSTPITNPACFTYDIVN